MGPHRPPSSGVLRDAYRYCEWINARHYENFPVGSWLLPRPIRPHVAAIYAFARCADDFADERKYQGRSLELLGAWREALAVIATPTPNEVRGRGKQPLSDRGGCFVGPEGPPRNDGSHPIFLALADTVRKFNLPVQLLDDLLTAFTMDVSKRRYADWEELLTYCRHSANPVGRLVLLLCGIRDPQLHAYSDSICTGLQLANHWQDLRIDAARDILYMPRTLMDQHGVTEQEIRRLAGTEAVRLRDTLRGGGPTAGHPAEQGVPIRAASDSRSGPPPNGAALPPGFVRLMRELVGRARELFDAGEPLVPRLSGGLRLEIRLTLLGGRAVLDRIERAGFDVFRRRPVLSGLDKARLLTRALLS